MANVIISEEEYNELKKDRNNWRDWYYELRYALRKDETLDESISCIRDIPSDVEMIEDLKKRAADSDYYKEMSDLLEEKLKNANELADSWKRDYERIREQFLCPIYNILYPDNPNLNINVTDLLRDIKDLKIYEDENGRMYKELQEWREKCISRGKDIDHLFSEDKEKDKKISELETRIKYWSNVATGNADKLTSFKRKRDKWRTLYNSLSETCTDYDKRCKEEFEKKYRDEISKLQNIVTEKEVEIKGLKKDIVNLSYDRRTVESISKKKEMCKEENENA